MVPFSGQPAYAVRADPVRQMVFQAIQTYGMVVTDYAGAVMLEAEQPSDWAAEGNSGTDPITASWDGQPEYGVVATCPGRSSKPSSPTEQLMLCAIGPGDDGSRSVNVPLGDLGSCTRGQPSRQAGKERPHRGVCQPVQ